MSPFPTTFQALTPEATDNVQDRLAKLESRVLSAEQLFAAGGFSGNVTVMGNLSVTGTTMLTGTVTVTSYVESGFLFSHYVDASANTAPVSAEIYHETSSGTPAVGDGTSIDFSMDSDTTKRQVGARFTASWLTATHATRTSQIRFFVESSGSLVQALQFSATTFGAFGTGAVTKQVSGANVTNNVTVGGTDDTIADFADLTTFANSAAAIRNDIYQLARKVKQINDGLRAYGLLT